MKLNHILIGLLLWAIAFGSQGCKKFLSENPDLRPDPDSAEKLKELLVNAYAKGTYAVFTEAASDNAADKGLERPELSVNADAWKFQRINDARNDDGPLNFWLRSYEAIAYANTALEAYSRLPQPQQDSSILGEAYVARAFNHFMLVCLFAPVYDEATAGSDPGIPYVTEAGKRVITKYERKTVAYVYNQIENDLTRGLPLINDARYKAQKYHFTRAAAHAFAARFYLFKKDFAKAAAHAEQVYGENLFPYLRKQNTLAWRSLEYYDKAAYFCAPANPSNLLLVEAPSLLARNVAGYRYGLTTALNAELFFSGNVAGGNYPYMLYGQIAFYNHPKWYEHFVRDGLQANYGNAYVTHVALTVDELLLNRAESYANLGDYEKALRDLNQFSRAKFMDGTTADSYSAARFEITEAKIKEFYKTTDTRDALVSTALDFRRREFLFEGLRYFDILRHRIPVTHVTFDNAKTYHLSPDDPKRLFEMPEEVVLSGIEGNPK